MEYLTRKKTKMGIDYEIEVKLQQYDAILRVHAVPDMALAKIEERLGYTLEEAISSLSGQDLTEQEIESLKSNSAEASLVQKAAKALSPKLTLFMGELAKAGISPSPAEGLPAQEIPALVDELKGFAVLELGMAVIGASTASWETVADFFSQKKAASGPA